MSNNSRKDPLRQTIGVIVSPQVKKVFKRCAEERGISESELGRPLLERYLIKLGHRLDREPYQPKSHLEKRSYRSFLKSIELRVHKEEAKEAIQNLEEALILAQSAKQGSLIWKAAKALYTETCDSIEAVSDELDGILQLVEHNTGIDIAELGFWEAEAEAQHKAQAAIFNPDPS